MVGIKTRTEDIRFIEHCLKRVWAAAGGSDEHGSIIAHAISFAHRQGNEKLNQGLGVYEVLDIALTSGNLDVTAVPEMVSEGQSWAVFDGKRSSGYYALHMMAEPPSPRRSSTAFRSASAVITTTRAALGPTPTWRGSRTWWRSRRTTPRR